MQITKTPPQRHLIINQKIIFCGRNKISLRPEAPSNLYKREKPPAFKRMAFEIYARGLVRVNNVKL